MGQFISFKSEINNPWFNPWFILLHTHSNVCATVEGRCLEYLVCITLLLSWNKFLVTSENNFTMWPFGLCFCEYCNICFKFHKILLYFILSFIKLLHFCMFIIQNSWQIFSFSQNLKFFKISQWNLIFSCKFKLSPLCVNEEKWKKCWVVYVCYRFILEQCVALANQ